MKIIKSFEKFGDLKNPQILILGTLPGGESLQNNRYYESSKNKFWEILGRIFSEENLKNYEYVQKEDFFKKEHILLWDIYEEGERENGSKDKDIKNGKFNNIKELLYKHKTIKMILVHSATARKELEEYIKKENLKEYLEMKNIKHQYVPSPSNSNTRQTFEEKVKIWKEALNI